MKEHLNSIECNFRFNKYTTPDANGTKFGLSPHTDKNLITFLDQNGTNGLEVLIKDSDDQWVEVNFTPNSLFVFIGEVYHVSIYIYILYLHKILCILGIR